LQKWYAEVVQAGRQNPYVLYAASNAGSLCGLFLYPLVVEQEFSREEQRNVWLAGCAALLVIMALCAVAPRRFPHEGQTHTSEPTPTRRTFLGWVLLALLPSSLLISVTTHLTTDIAPVPLLWIVPLTLYLLSFIIVFLHWPDRARVITSRVAIMLSIFLAVVMLSRATEPLALAGGIPLLALFTLALLSHGELAATRPAPQYLTRFYLALALGGVAGGVLNSMLAPVLFSRFGLIEYPLVLIALTLVRPFLPLRDILQFTRSDVVIMLGYAGLVLTLLLGVPHFLQKAMADDPLGAGLLGQIQRGVTYGIPAMIAYAWAYKPARFAGCLAILFLAGAIDPETYGNLQHTSRNFFGVLRVTQSTDGRMMQLVHGTTIHGQEWRDRPGEPLMYYHRQGPAGSLLEKLPAERRKTVGVVGLGCGALAAYARPGETWTFFEIDPAVARIAGDPRYFHFLERCQGEARVVLGDARRQLQKDQQTRYDVLILDAFSSDAIPVHLLTREAFALYAERLTPGGILLVHVSNRYLDLPPLVRALADTTWELPQTRANLDLTSDPQTGRAASIWVLVDPTASTRWGAAWQPVPDRLAEPWTDDRANLWQVWKRTPE
jgi:hypothetical protein